MTDDIHGPAKSAFAGPHAAVRQSAAKIAACSAAAERRHWNDSSTAAALGSDCARSGREHLAAGFTLKEQLLSTVPVALKAFLRGRHRGAAQGPQPGITKVNTDGGGTRGCSYDDMQ